MKKKNYLKKICILAVGIIGAGNVFAGSNTVCFDRPTNGSAGWGTTIWSDIPLSNINCNSMPVPIGSTWSVQGEPIHNYFFGEHFWGYGEKDQSFTFSFENFPYHVDQIHLSSDGGKLSQGEAVLTVTQGSGKSSAITINPDFEINITSNSYINNNGGSGFEGLQSVSLIMTKKGKMYFNSSNFLKVDYQNPKITVDNKALSLYRGQMYKITDKIRWTYRGLFTEDNLRFSSDATSVATVSPEGIITAVGNQGTAKIRVWVVNTDVNGNHVISTCSGGANWTQDEDSYFEITVTIDKNLNVENNIATATGTWTGEALQSAINQKAATATSIDLTNTTISGAPIAITTPNPNTLIKANEGQVSNTSNVIVDGVCNKLVLTDGQRFRVDEAFTANATEYIRQNTDTWGAICLPYAPVPTETTAYYALESVGESSLTFTKVENPQANTPYLYKNLTGENYNASQNADVNVIVTPANIETSAIDYKMCGAFNPTSVVDGVNYTTAKNASYDLIEDPNAYYFKDNQFNKLNGRFNMGGFRAYLTTSSSNAKTSVISINFNDITTGVKFVENEEKGTVEIIFDLNGRRLEAQQKGVNIVKGKKILVK